MNRLSSIKSEYIYCFELLFDCYAIKHFMMILDPPLCKTRLECRVLCIIFLHTNCYFMLNSFYKGKGIFIKVAS